MEPWMPPEALAACGRETLGDGCVREHDRSGDPGLFGQLVVAGLPGSTLWNSMVAPLLDLEVSGWLWYQGESNVGDQPSFEKCFPAMINSWRAHWANRSATQAHIADVSTPLAAPKAKPFVFFQLAPWPGLDLGAIPSMRLVQMSALALPEVGMVVTADQGDSAGAFHPIHPPSKAELSRRAALVLDRLVYGNVSSPLQGPQVVESVFDPWLPSWGDFHEGTGLNSYVCAPRSGFSCGGVRVTFDQELVLASDYGDLYSYDNGLRLWDANMTKFQPAMLTRISSDRRTLQLNTTWTFGEAGPAVLRYACSDYPTMKLYNAFGLPAPPFTAQLVRAPSVGQAVAFV